jgi:hypothetical protein
VSLVAFVALAYIALKLAPDWFAETKGLEPKDQATARQSVRTATLALLAGGLAVLGSFYTARTYALNRAGQITDRFTKAIEQLGHPTAIDVRLGGIYALERIARDSKHDHPQVVEVLTAYIREHAPRHASETSDTPPNVAAQPPTRNPSGPPSTDVQAALTVLNRRKLEHEDETTPKPNLSGANLSGGDLRGANLSGANLSGANLSGAGLRRADLSRASLLGADLRGANLGGADLRGANLGGADLGGANLSGADLGGANLGGADLGEANLSGANLSGANLSRANLSRASLLRAGLSGADLGGVRHYETRWPDGFDAARLPPPALS